MHRPSAPSSSSSPPPVPAAPRTRWWQTVRARVGFFLAVPVLGLISPYLGFAMMVVAVFLVWKDGSWNRGTKAAATVVAFALLGSVAPDRPEDGTRGTEARPGGKAVVGAGTGDAGTAGIPARTTPPPPPSPSPTARPRPAAKDYRGMSLDDARKAAEAAGFGVDEHDASDQDKSIWMRLNWTVCFQRTGWTSSGTKTIDFGAVKKGAPCPREDGGAIPWPTMPNLVWKTWRTAHKEVAALGTVPADRVMASTAYVNDQLPDEGEYDDWRVCVTDPAEGEDVTVDLWVTLELTHPDNGCPAPDREDGDRPSLPDRDDDGDPDYRDPFPGDRHRNSTFPNGLPGGSGGSSDGNGSGGGWNCPRTRWC
ncbi:PASTA domain-containing protein [Streptomyces cinereoruber]|uniref:PASTA domain-containing protein n=1 Tax=Streptomyces cinereoruber TaxID=67260 RepID=UPI003C2DFCDA